MPTALSDPTTSLYVILGAIAVILGLVAARRQKRSDVINFLIPAVALLALFVIDRATESPREQAVRKLQEMEAASQAKNYDEVFKHVSEAFQYKSLDKKALRDRANLALTHFPEGVRIWNATRNNFKEVNESTVEQEFDVQPVNAPQFRHLCVGVFKKDPDGEWRLASFRLYPVVGGGGGERQEVSVPGL
jgi:hypothetical protein